MSVNKSEKQELLERLNELLKKQSLFQQEINDLQLQITQLRVDRPEIEPIAFKASKETAEAPKEIQKVLFQRKEKKQKTKKERWWNKSGFGVELEKFIGENLINKIGIAVVIIGVGIGAKYAIDNDLISPLIRIILGYLVGGTLTFFALRLKKKYFNFSAVLFSGAMAIYYFITYAAYEYYQLLPNFLAFILMVFITVLTVALALYYNRQIIAHYGLVGAYIVPFLLKDPNSSVLVLLSYMFIINCGILFISTKKSWKLLNYLAFVATWVIFIVWFSSKDYNNQFLVSLTFSTLFFAIFYLVFLSYKLILKEKYKIEDVFFLLLNAGIFYLVGTIALSIGDYNDEFSGLFTFINALVHGATAFLVYKLEKKSKNLFYWTLGIVVAFVTIAIGVQFNQYVVAILWSLEAAFLFWLSKSKKIQIFDFFSFVIILCTFIAFIVNWAALSYNFYTDSINVLFKPVFSLNFLSSLLIILSFAFIYYTGKKSISTEIKNKNWIDFFNVSFPIIILITVFFTFYSEINLFWNNIQIYTSYELNSDEVWVKAYDKLNRDIFSFSLIWLINYTLLFTAVLSFINFKWIKSNLLYGFIFVFFLLMVFIFLTSGLNAFTRLRTSYLANDLPGNYDVNIFHILIRYVAFVFFAFLLFYINRFCIVYFSKANFRNAFEIVLSITIIWICSNELIHWLSLYGNSEVYKHGLSILWGVLSFILIGYGIWKKKKHLRITSIVLFGATIIKIFVYDLTNLETIQKTIVFLSIGALLLVVSFMYNKYRDVIFGSD